ncbi:unnamed protein product, partial [Ilex paraguariensis]
QQLFSSRHQQTATSTQQLSRNKDSSSPATLHKQLSNSCPAINAKAAPGMKQPRTVFSQLSSQHQLHH